MKNFKEYLLANPEIKESAQTIKAVLDAGMTPMQGEDSLYDFKLTAREVGIIVMGIVSFHPRGEEFRQYWVKRNNFPDHSGKVDITELAQGFRIRKRKQ